MWGAHSLELVQTQPIAGFVRLCDGTRLLLQQFDELRRGAAKEFSGGFHVHCSAAENVQRFREHCREIVVLRIDRHTAFPAARSP